MLTSRGRGELIVMLAMVSLALSSCQIFGGSSDDPMQELRQQVSATVTDLERQRQMLESIDRMDAMLGEMASQFAAVIKRKRELFANYDSTREEFELLLTTGSRDRQQLQRAFLENHIQFKSLLTEDEWDIILPVQTRAVTRKTEILVAAALAR